MNDQGMFLRMTHANGQTVTVTNPDPDIGWEEFLSTLRAFSVAAGFLESNVNEVFGDI